MRRSFQFYSDEQYPRQIIEKLQLLGHDVFTAYADGRANLKIDDFDVLARATELGRAVLTRDRNDFHHLHQDDPDHAGIVTTTHDPDHDAVAARIDIAIQQYLSLKGILIRITRPRTP